jgi:hypothetical protein
LRTAQACNERLRVSPLFVEPRKSCEPVNRFTRHLEPIHDAVVIRVTKRHPADDFVARFDLKMVCDDCLVTQTRPAGTYRNRASEPQS